MKLRIGLGKKDMTAFIPGIGMMGYGQHHNVVREVATTLWARVLVIEDKESRFILAHLEQAFVTIALKEEVLKRLNSLYPDWNIGEDNLAITAQHTHSAPGGYSHYPFYNFTIPGFQTRVMDKVAGAVVSAIEEASAKLIAATLEYGSHEIPENVEVAFNRSIKAHALNPEAVHHTEQEKHLAVNRTMEGLSFKGTDGKLLAFLNWFAVHCTSISSFNQRIHHDNKGVAAELFETNHPGTIAFFLQAAAGDVSPNFIWDKKTKRMRGKFSDQFDSAAYNGELQFRESEKITFNKPIAGELEFHHLWLDMATEVAPPAHGVAFFKGTLEGPGVPSALADAVSVVASLVKKYRLLRSPEHHREFYEAHGTKDVILDHRNGSFLGIPLKIWKVLPPLPEPSVEALRKTAKANALETLPWIPTILPFQLLRIGELVIAFCPGEITTIAGKRLKDFLTQELQSIGVREVIVSSYANAFMGYITTPEEYDKQCYEGGHTVFGRNTFYGILKGFSLLANRMKGRETQVKLPQGPFHFPPEELARRTV